VEGVTRKKQTHRIGLIGGTSWRSTALYYERLNRALEAELGMHHSFCGDVCNLDYATLTSMADASDWQGIECMLTDAAMRLDRSGCDVIALTAVTAHRWYDSVRSAAAGAVPHILAAAADRLDALGIRTAGVLGTSITCGSDFVADYLGRDQRKLIFLAKSEQAEIDHQIQSILTASDTVDAGRETLRRAVVSLQSRGVESVVLACTELPLLLPIDTPGATLLDCVTLHIGDICNHILSESHA
jgi:aspartate racemase